MNLKTFQGLNDQGTLLEFSRGVIFFGNKKFDPLDWPEISTKSSYLNQIHGNKVVPAQRKKLETADGQFTSHFAQPLMIRTADCMPVFLSINNFETIYALHIGWKGLQNRILSKALQTHMKNGDQISMWVGPHIKGKSFYLHKENAESLFTPHTLSLEEALNSGLAWPSPNFRNQFQIDLVKLLQMEASEVGIKNIYVHDIDTFSSLDHYSHRRYSGSTKRLFSFISKVR